MDDLVAWALSLMFGASLGYLVWRGFRPAQPKTEAEQRMDKESWRWEDHTPPLP